MAAGLKKDGAILVNTQKEPAEIKKQLKGFEGRVYTVDALNISLETLGRYFNTPMLGAVVKVSG